MRCELSYEVASQESVDLGPDRGCGLEEGKADPGVSKDQRALWISHTQTRGRETDHTRRLDVQQATERDQEVSSSVELQAGRKQSGPVAGG